MLKTLLIAPLLIFHFSSTGNCQSTTIDSLEKRISLAPTDSERIDAAFALADHYSETDKPKSLLILKQSLAWSQKKDKKLQARCLNKIGDFYWYSGNYALASDNYYTALYLCEEIQDKKGAATCYRNIGWIYLDQRNYEQSGVYFRKSLRQTKKYGKESELIPCYDDLGILYRTTGSYQKALKSFEQTISLAKKYGDRKAIAGATADLAATYLKMGQLETSRLFFLESIALHENTPDNYNLCDAYLGLGECYIQLKDGREALHYLLKALNLAKGNGFVQPEILALKQMGRAYALLGDAQRGYEFIYRYAILSDSLHDDNQNRLMHEMSAKYESDKKEASIRSLHRQERLMAEKLSDATQFRVFVLVFSGIALILTFSFFRSYRDNKRANRRLARANEEIETRNKDISDSIHYARQIQRARLPDPDTIYELFPQTFGLFKPKDIVSGDFYWFADLKNGKRAFAAADCTGHGIPGAFMSLIGIDTLHHAMIETRLTKPSEILACVNRSLKKSMKQHDQSAGTRDGMDIALCVFDEEKMELHYAGAHRPLILIRGNEITELKPTKQAIGGLTDNEQQFETHVLKLQKNDMIYVFSDGFADQFGGNCDKKYGTKKFKELLLSVNTKSMAEQEEMLDIVFEAWRGNNEQIDDVLVIGVRI